VAQALEHAQPGLGRCSEHLFPDPYMSSLS
jgi:hypothetical protein